MKPAWAPVPSSFLRQQLQADADWVGVVECSMCDDIGSDSGI